MSLLRLIPLLAMLIVPAIAYAGSVSVTATFRERLAPPPNSRLVVILQDVSAANSPAREIGRTEIENAGMPPYSVQVSYENAAIQESHRYAVRAMLFDGDDLLFTTEDFAPVLTWGAPQEVEIVMQRVPQNETASEEENTLFGAHGLLLPASFTGTLPCADCEGISYHLDLWPDQIYHLRRAWLKNGEIGTKRDELGRWYADVARQAIILYGAGEMPLQWEIKGPQMIRQLDMAGQPIESGLDYELSSDGSLQETDLDELFLGGMMTYMADAPIFEECMTGRVYPIAQEGDYLALERAYLADSSAPGEPLYVHVEGSLLMRPAMEGPDRRSLVVSRFIKTRPGITCERQMANASLVNTYWRINSLAGEVVVAMPNRREPHIILRDDEKRNVSATIGCNNMVGSYERQDDALSFGPMAATMMACPPPLDKLERTLGETLSKVRSFAISGETLVLYDEEDQVVAELSAVYLK